MFCYQCEQTAKGQGCEKVGVCGKQPEVAALQDLLVHALQRVSLVAVAGRQAGVVDREVDTFVCEAAFSTLTNVNFDPQRFVPLIHRNDAYSAIRNQTDFDSRGRSGGHTGLSASGFQIRMR